MFTITIEPAEKGQVTAKSSDGRSFVTTAPLLDGARCWLEQGANAAASIVTVWSSGSTAWALRSTSIGAAAKLTVRSNKRGKPVFQYRQDSRESIAGGSYSS
jgi:hypothetical protein